MILAATPALAGAAAFTSEDLIADFKTTVASFLAKAQHRPIKEWDTSKEKEAPADARRLTVFAPDDEQLKAYAEAAVELNHNNHGGLGAISSRDVTKAVAARIRASRRTNLSDRQSRGERRDNHPKVRAARAGPLERFATRRGGAGQYTED